MVSLSCDFSTTAGPLASLDSHDAPSPIRWGIVMSGGPDQNAPGGVHARLARNGRGMEWDTDLLRNVSRQCGYSVPDIATAPHMSLEHAESISHVRLTPTPREVAA